MQGPIARGIALRSDASASGLHFQCALGAFDFHIARTCPDFHVARRGLFEFYAATAAGSAESSGDSDCAIAATPGDGFCGAVNFVEFDISRSRARMCFTANSTEPHTAGTAAGI